jgi:hypothetical protein
MAASLRQIVALAHLRGRDRRERPHGLAGAGLPEGRVGDVKPVVGIQRHADGGDAGCAFANQFGQAQHVRMGARHGQGRRCGLPRHRIDRQPVGRQVAKVVLRVDDQKLDVFLHVVLR